MLYKRSELPKHINDNGRIAIKRYLYRFFHQRKEIGRLKWHEKDFLFNCMYIMTYDDDKKFDLMSVPEAQDWFFNHLILIYLGENRRIDFSKPAHDYYGLVPKELKKKHQTFFWKKLGVWKDELELGKGKYCGILRNEYFRKLDNLNRMSIPKVQKIQKQIYIRATFYYIYYIIRMYFDEKPEKYDLEVISDINVVADIYSYCHVLSRHYFWLMTDNGASLNEDIPILDIKNLPQSLLKLVRLHCKVTPLNITTEYLLFEYDHVKYILWLKYKKIDNTNIMGLHIRSFYKCIVECDLDKYQGKRIEKIEENLFCYV